MLGINGTKFLTHSQSKVCPPDAYASAALKRLIEGQLPHEKDEDYIFNVIALLAARSPEKRENWRRFNASIAEGLIGWNLSSKENYEASMSKDSSTTEKEISYEDMKSFFESNAYKIDMSVSSHLEMEIESIDTILPPVSYTHLTLPTILLV